MTRSLMAFAFAALLPSGIVAQSDIRGAWEAERYVLKNGTEHQLSGHIFFDQNEWTVLFFVLDGVDPKRGSAEGGTYTLNGNDLVFTHFYNLSVGSEMEGLAEAALRMTSQPRGPGTEESSTIDIAGDLLTIYFPSGNSMIFRRLP